MSRSASTLSNPLKNRIGQLFSHNQLGKASETMNATEKEFEKKIQLTETAYRKWIELFKHLQTECFTQINYYYDTENELFRKQKTTCRIRQIGNYLKGTKKTHVMKENSMHSIEQSFTVNDFQESFVIDNEKVFLKGQMTTERTIVPLAPDINLMLDQNMYLGTVDYELELEFSYEHEADAIGIMTLIDTITPSHKSASPLSKSERFFKRLHQIGY